MTKRKLYIAVPSYSGDLNYTTQVAINVAVRELSDAGWADTELVVRGSDANVPRARNILFTQFVDHTQCSDMLFWDADIACNPGAVLRLMEHPHELVGAAYPARKDNPVEFVLHQDQPHIDVLPSGLAKVGGLGTGFLRISRSCAERVRAWCSTQGLWFTDRTAPGMDKVWRPFSFELRDHQEWSEDYIFCRTWRALGGEVWCDTALIMHHTGMKTFSGAFLSFLQERGGRSASILDQAKGIVQQALAQEAARAQATILDGEAMPLRTLVEVQPAGAVA